MLHAVWRCEEVNYEGLRVNFDIRRRSPPSIHSNSQNSVNGNVDVVDWSGWCMLRASLHEPILSMQIESDQPGGAAVVSKVGVWQHNSCLHPIYYIF